MKIAFQMEPMDEPVKGESHTLILMEEACWRGFEVYHYHPDDVFLNNEGVFAKAARVHVDLSKDKHFTLNAYETTDLSEMSVVLFRQDPPYDMRYVTNTFLLDNLKSAGVLFVNDPYWIRNMSDKLSGFEFKEYLPPILVGRDLDEIEAFLIAHKEVVIKPLYSFHGYGITKSFCMDEIKKVVEKSPVPFMFQPFLPEAFDGTKRILFFDGEVVGAIKSVPPVSKEDFRIFRESTDIACDITEEELEMCAKMSPVFKERGLIFAGVDLIGKYLIEINAGSVGSLVRFNEVYGGQWEAKLWDVIERKVSAKSP